MAVSTTGTTPAATATTISCTWSRLVTPQVWRKRPRVRVSEAMAKEPGEQRTGGIVRRGVERKIEDRKLLERPESAPEFLESDPWRVLRIQAEFVAGLHAPGTGGPAGPFFCPPRPPPPPPLDSAPPPPAAAPPPPAFRPTPTPRPA